MDDERTAGGGEVLPSDGGLKGPDTREGTKDRIVAKREQARDAKQGLAAHRARAVELPGRLGAHHLAIAEAVLGDPSGPGARLGSLNRLLKKSPA